MEIYILNASTGRPVEATIRKAEPEELPGMHEGWNFNFAGLIRKMKYARAYILATQETPDEPEGCLIFEMIDNEIPHMAYVEVAPHNFGKNKRYDKVAGCMISFAYTQTYVFGNSTYGGLLYFEVSERNPENQRKLMCLYAERYNAKHIAGTRGKMLISDDDGNELVKTYLNRPPFIT